MVRFQKERTYVQNLRKFLNNFPFYGSILLNFSYLRTLQNNFASKNMGTNQTLSSLGRHPARVMNEKDSSTSNVLIQISSKELGLPNALFQ